MSVTAAATLVRSTVTEASPVILPSAIPAGWSAVASATCAAFMVTYTAPNGVDANIGIELAIPNPPPLGPHGLQRALTFRGDPRSLYRVVDTTAPADGTGERFLLWTEPGRWPVQDVGGVPYRLWSSGLTEAEFWRVAASLG